MFENSPIQNAKKYRVLLVSFVAVLAIIAVKFFIHQFGLEFFSVNSLTTSAIGGAVFILGFLLAGVFSDYKESEKIPPEMRASMESMWVEAKLLKRKQDLFDIETFRKKLIEIIDCFRNGLGREGDHKNLKPALAAVDDMEESFAEMDALGMPPNFLARLKSDQSNLIRQISRVYYIQRMQFVPSVFILAKSLVAAVVALLLFIKTEGSPESMALSGIISFMFIYVLHLIQTLEKPFRKGRDSLDDVSLFLIHELESEIRNDGKKSN